MESRSGIRINDKRQLKNSKRVIRKIEEEGANKWNPKMEGIWRGIIILKTFVLDGLTLALRGAFGYGATHEDDELLHAGTLEVTEVAYIWSVTQNHRIRTLTRAFKHQQSRDLHLSIPFSLSLSSLISRVRSFVVFSCSLGFAVGRRKPCQRTGNGK